MDVMRILCFTVFQLSGHLKILVKVNFSKNIFIEFYIFFTHAYLHILHN